MSLTPNNTTLPQFGYTSNSGITTSNPFVTYYSLRDPTSNDVNFPIQKRWLNFSTTPPKEWVLESLPGASNSTTANWVLLTGPGSGPIYEISVPNGTSPVFADSVGNFNFVSTGGTVVMTGSTNTINFDIVGGTAPIQRLETDDGLFETPTGTPGTITIHGTGPITTSQGTAHQVNINIASGSLVETIEGDDSVKVSPDSSGNINLNGNVVANSTHSKAVYTESPSANHENIDVQVAAAISSTNIAKVGLSAFNSTEFTVDSNGFVSLVSSPSQGFIQINTQVFTATGTSTYTPTTNMAYCIVEVVGAGGGGGGAATASSTQTSSGAGGGGGGYARKVLSAATVGSSQTITVGTGGSGGSSGGGNGSTGGTSSFGSLVSATGGGGGQSSGPSGVACAGATSPGSGSGGDFNTNGGPGETGFGLYYTTIGSTFVYSGNGGSSFFGGGGLGGTLNGGTSYNGNPGQTYGGGGAGALVGNGATGKAGGAGANGIVIVTEYIT